MTTDRYKEIKDLKKKHGSHGFRSKKRAMAAARELNAYTDKTKTPAQHGSVFVHYNEHGRLWYVRGYSLGPDKAPASNRCKIRVTYSSPISSLRKRGHKV